MKIDKLTQIKVLAMIIAFCGLCLLLGTTYNLQWVGISMAFAAGLFVATSFIVSKPLTEDLSPLTMAVFATGLPCLAYAISSISVATSLIPKTFQAVSVWLQILYAMRLVLHAVMQLSHDLVQQERR